MIILKSWLVITSTDIFVLVLLLLTTTLTAGATITSITTTVMLIGGLSQVKQSRLQQLVDWCGGQTEFDGCLIFDECHKAKHFIPVRIYSVSSLLKLRLLPMMFDL